MPGEFGVYCLIARIVTSHDHLGKVRIGHPSHRTTVASNEQGMSKKDLSEQEIRTRFITPALRDAGWELRQIREEHYFTDGRMHIQGFPTTNHYGATADGLVIAYRAGAKIIDMDSVQYHPTGVAYPTAILGKLATEKLRSQGDMPVNKFGDSFVYPLEPRDVEAAAIIRECWGRENCIETTSGMRGVWLDTPMIDEIHGQGTLKARLAAMWTMWNRHGIDITRDPVLVYPTLHYQNGGIEIDADGATNVPGLYAAGECDGGIHGKNRLMGNSQLDIYVFGRRAGLKAAEQAMQTKTGALSLQHALDYSRDLKQAGIDPEHQSPMLLPDYRAEAVRTRSLGRLI